MNESATQFPEAEETVLGAVLVDPESLPVIRGQLRKEHFYAPRLGRVYGAMCQLSDRNEAIDLITLSSELERSGERDPKQLVASLMNVTHTAASITHHARLVRGAAVRRDCTALLETALRRMREGTEPVDVIASDVQSDLLDAAVYEHTKGYQVIDADVIDRLMEAIEARGIASRLGNVPHLATGFVDIDRETNGFRPGELVILGGVPKSWKTACCLNIALNAIHKRQHVATVSAEMTKDSLLERMINMAALVHSSSTSRGVLDGSERQRIMDHAYPILASGRLHIDDEAFPELGDVIARAVHLKSRVPDLALIIVDYLQLVTKRMHGRRGDEELNEICRGLKGLAKKTQTVVIAPAQVNYKAVDERADKRPEPRDLQGASGMAQTADFVGMVFNPRMYDQRHEPVIEIDFWLSRRTPRFQVTLQASPAHMLLSDYRPDRSRRSA